MASKTQAVSVPVLELQDRQVEAFQRHTTGSFLDCLPSSSTINNNDTAFLVQAPVDSVPKVLDKRPTPSSGQKAPWAEPELCSWHPEFQQASATDAAVHVVADERDRVTAATLHQHINDIQSCLDRMMSTCSQLVASRGKHRTLAAARKIAKLASIPTVPATPVMVVSQVLDELPTPSPAASDRGSPTSMVAPISAPSEATNTPCESTAPENVQGVSTNGDPTLALNFCVPDDSTNVSEQNIDQRPQQYGFHNLSQNTVFLADGTERSYYALPEEYSLKQTTPSLSPSATRDVDVTTQLPVTAQAADVQDFTSALQPQDTQKSLVNVQQLQAPKFNLLEIDEKSHYSNNDVDRSIKSSHKNRTQSASILCVQAPTVHCTDEFIEVFTGTPEQQKCTEHQQDEDHLRMCRGHAPGIEQTNACMNYTYDVSIMLELQQQDVEKTSVTIQQLGGQHCDMLENDEPRTKWNPGALKLRTLFPTAVGAFYLTHELNTEIERTVLSVHKASANALSQDTAELASILVPCLVAERQNKCSSNMQGDERRREIWDPGDHTLMQVTPPITLQSYTATPSIVTHPGEHAIQTSTLNKTSASVLKVPSLFSTAVGLTNDQNFEIEHTVMSERKTQKAEQLGAVCYSCTNNSTEVNATVSTPCFYPVPASYSCKRNSETATLPARCTSTTTSVQTIVVSFGDVAQARRDDGTLYQFEYFPAPRHSSVVCIGWREANVSGWHGTDTTPVHVQQMKTPWFHVLIIAEPRNKWDPVLSASCQEIKKDCFTNRELVANASCKVAVLTWHSPLSSTPIVPVSITYTWDPGILCMTDGQIGMGRVLPEQCKFWVNAMQYYIKFQKCIAKSSQLYGQDCIESNEVALWLIQFQPP